MLTVTEWQPRTVVRREYTSEELNKAFNRVANSKNWKNRINRVVEIKDDEERDLISEAIIHFTGSCPDFIEQSNGKVRVVANGYYATIGA